MGIRKITEEELRRMEGREGLVLQGCGGDPQEWLDGINGMLAEAGILKDGAKFGDIYSFEHDGLACLLYPFEGVGLDMGKLSVWRLKTHEAFGGTWLSDFVPNRLGGFVGEASAQKPDCALIGQDGNVFSLVGIASRTLRENGMGEKAEKMQEAVFAAGSYGEALSIIGKYVNITAAGEEKKPSVLRQLKETKPPEHAAPPKPGKGQER